MNGLPHAIDRQYAVVELCVDGKSYASPYVTSWLKDLTLSLTKNNKELIVAKTCHWPDDESNLATLLLLKSKPRPDWIKLANIRVFTFCASLFKAKSQAEKAMGTRDISDAEKKNLPSKRVRRAINKFQAGGNSSSDEEADHSVEMPPMKKLKINSAAFQQLEISEDESTIMIELGDSLNGEGSDDNGQHTDHSTSSLVGNLLPNANGKGSRDEVNDDQPNASSIIPNISTHPTCRNLFKGPQLKKNTNGANQTNSYREMSSSGKRTQTTPKENAQSNSALNSQAIPPKDTINASGPPKDTTLQLDSSRKKASHNSAEKTPLKKQTPPSNKNKSPFKLNSEVVVGRTMLAAFNKLSNDVAELHKLVYRIYTVVCNPEEMQGGRESEMPHLPLKTEEDFTKFSEYCEDSDKMLAMMKYLSEFGGKDLKTSVNSIMAKVLANKFATSYNNTGFNQKNATVEQKKFIDTIPHKVVKGAVKLHVQFIKRANPNNCQLIFNTTQLTSACSDWLKDASKRLSNEDAKQKRHAERARRQAEDELGDNANEVDLSE